MNVTIKPCTINGTITPPPSKSITQRVFAAALLHRGKTIVQNSGQSADELAALDVIQLLGATTQAINDDTILISSNGITNEADKINCGESGLAARLFTPIVATTNKSIIISGEGSLLQRPMTAHIETLSSLGVEISSTSNLLPLTIAGPLQPDNITIDGSLSSQFLSGLLIAYAFTAKKEVEVKVSELASYPYIDLTLQTLKYFGKNIVNNDYKQFTITPIEEIDSSDIYYHIENDWSAAAALLVAGAIAGKVTIENTEAASLQADKAILEVLKQVGAKLDINDYSVTCEKNGLNAFSFDATHCPDLFPVLSILAGACSGTSIIKGASRLIHKESNRLESISDMLSQFGIEHQHLNDELHIIGTTEIKAGTINSHNDHRIVMAAAIGGLVATGTTTIKGAKAIDKSYPDFFAHLLLSGVEIEQS